MTAQPKSLSQPQPGLGASVTQEYAPTRAASDGSLDATIAAGDTRPLEPRDAFASAATITDADAAITTERVGRISSMSAGPRHSTTVLPRVEQTDGSWRLVHSDRTRYETTRVLGEGGMGEVALARDNDIGRDVALKRLRGELENTSAVARFVDEVRTVGALEHPNIVPIHDVGIDEAGRYFFVMKFVDGETLEQIIEKLTEGDAAYHARYTIERRVQIFLGLLNALQYAHDRGIVHRDIKPANVMVGPFGEVMLMDWGIARPIGSTDSPASDVDASNASTAANGSTETGRSRASMTRQGALVGTPAYMSPEQARGDNAALDVRSDLYSATVVLHELLGLRHYLSDRESVPAILEGVMVYDAPIVSFGFYNNPHQPAPPAEYMHFCKKGMSKDPSQRFSSAAEMASEVMAIVEGRLHVQCAFTMTKRMWRELGRFTDRHPVAAFLTFVLMVGMVLASLGILVRQAIA